MKSGWKLFCSMLEELRESYLSKNNLAIAKVLTDPDKTATEQFWECLERMQVEKSL
jgi:hypothetical protein